MWKRVNGFQAFSSTVFSRTQQIGHLVKQADKQMAQIEMNTENGQEHRWMKIINK